MNGKKDRLSKREYLIEPSNFSTLSGAEITRKILETKGWACSQVSEYVTKSGEVGYKFDGRKRFVIGKRDNREQKDKPLDDVEEDFK